MDKLEQKRIGLRIKAARVLTGLNQEEFAKACDFNHTSLRNWEFGRVAPRKEAIERLIDSFRSFSIFIDRDWIYFGKGEGPVFTVQENIIDPAQSSRSELTAFKKNCLEMGENALILNLEDDEMAPLYHKGDWVGGITRSMRGLVDHVKNAEIFSRPMLVKLEDKKLYLRRILVEGDLWFAKSDNSNKILPISGDLIGIVTIHISSFLRTI